MFKKALFCAVVLTIISSQPSEQFLVPTSLQIFQHLDCPAGLAEAIIERIKEVTESFQPYYNGILDSFQSMVSCSSPTCLVEGNLQLGKNIFLLLHGIVFAILRVLQTYATCLISKFLKMVKIL